MVVTGVGAISPLGHDWGTVAARLRAGESAVQVMPEWREFAGLNTAVGAPAMAFDLPPDRYSRKQTRSMGRVALMATRASELALMDAGLLGDPVVTSGALGIAYGSSTGSPNATADFATMLLRKSTEGITANSYLKMMAHTAAVNIGVFFGVTGRIVTTSSACTSGSQGIGYAFEMIRAGKQQVMLAGGAEELDVTEAAVFDTLFATTVKYNEQPRQTPRPFDIDRDGLVLGEGACTLVLEELSCALQRGARIYAEVLGYGTNSDGAHVTQPGTETMATAMRLAMADAAIAPERIGYVNAHGTSTPQGDIAESHATALVLGSQTPISSLKSYMGHTMGACGALEAWISIEMMRADWFAPTLNLHRVDPRCAKLDYIMDEGRRLQTDIVMSNNFAFGGINTSLIFRRWME
ncbi:MAG: beta-ketoacyl-ACP synthase [Nevskiaceae bacterium]|nr:beta-ketoacyl-ACP synthase [Nevskiaceae bacterium]